jgi:cytochrome c-type biogenesis protein CcmE
MKKTHIAGLLIIAGAVVAIILSIGDSSTYVTFGKADLYPNKEFHVVGELVREKEIYYNPVKDANFFSFYMKDNDGSVRRVILQDAKPQDFERSEQIVIVGKPQGDDFHASKILLKCPSKYQEDEIQIKEAGF